MRDFWVVHTPISKSGTHIVITVQGRNHKKTKGVGIVMGGFVTEWVIRALQRAIPQCPGICSHLLERHKFILCNGPSVDLIFIPKGGRHREFLFGQVTDRFEFAGTNSLQSILHTMLFSLNERPELNQLKQVHQNNLNESIIFYLFLAISHPSAALSK